ncbi:uncharacterized protein sowahb isoform X2 [Echeneis naucrates]|uniref:uncharacterized protein sowahb isoform X2 n=1 Tax=Echeneis naucrates TaxID=173247 RepID=UPI00111422DB|nr:uncharacterized protein LOC115052091 isoform X2 [Echeneis naucrates]
MATIFTQDAVLHFLQNHGGSVKNSDLLLHFRIFIRNHADQDRNRELFKKYVNSVATVKQQEGVSYVVLRKKFRGHIQDDVGEVFNMTARLSAPQSSESGRTGRTEEQRLKPQLSYAATAAASEKTPAQIMPVAGIVINNIIQTKLNPKQSQQRVNSAPNPSGGLAAVQVVSQVSEKTDRESNLSKPVVQDRRSTVAQHGVGVGLHPAVTPGISTGRHYWEDREQVSVCHSSGGREVCQQYEAGPGQETPLSPQFAPRCFRYRQSYKSAISYDEDDKVTISAPLGDTGRTISTSLPCIIDTLAPPLVVSASYSPSERNIPKIHIQDVEEKVQPLCYPDWGFESEASHKYIIPHNHQKSHVLGTQLKPRQDLHQPQRSSLSLSHSSKLSPSCDAGFYNSDRPPSCSSKGSEWNSSSISPQANAGELYDDHEEVESSEGSTWAPVLWQRPTVTRRVSSHLRNRMCRSLGADLDQLLQEEARGGSEAARLNRLHLISSSLSLPYNLSSSSLSSCSTPPQYCSLADLDDEKGGRRIITAVTSSTTHYEESGRQITFGNISTLKWAGRPKVMPSRKCSDTWQRAILPGSDEILGQLKDNLSKSLPAFLTISLHSGVICAV